MNTWTLAVSSFVLGFTALMIATIMLIKIYRMEGVTKKLSDRTNEVIRKEGVNIDTEDETKSRKTGIRNLDELKKDIKRYGVVGASSIWTEIDRLERENEELKRKIAGERVCDGYCEECVNGIIKKGAYGRTDYYCKLDCKCMDFKQKTGGEI